MFRRLLQSFGPGGPALQFRGYVKSGHDMDNHHYLIRLPLLISLVASLTCEPFAISVQCCIYLLVFPILPSSYIFQDQLFTVCCSSFLICRDSSDLVLLYLFIASAHAKSIHFTIHNTILMPQRLLCLHLR